MRRALIALSSIVLMAAASTALAEDDCRVVVAFKGAADAKLLAERGVHVHHARGRIAVGKVAARRLAKLRAEPSVAYVEEDGIARVSSHTSQPAQTTPWGVAKVWRGTMPYTSGAGIRVAILDTGIDLAHPDLRANVAGNVTMVGGTSNGNDDNGHGTHVAGIVGAVNDAYGVVGVAPGARLYAVKVLDRRGSGYTSDIARGIDWTAANGIQIANMSFGTSSNSTTLANACTNANGRGVLLVAATGNSGDGNTATTETGYPAAYDSVLAVGATDSADRLAVFSNTGSFVDVSAPGVNVLSTYPGGRYATGSGTSMASPHAAGLAALYWSIMGSTTNANVRRELLSGVRDLGPAGFDPGYGFGLIRF